LTERQLSRGPPRWAASSSDSRAGEIVAEVKAAPT
jgi:hypothetical protein